MKVGRLASSCALLLSTRGLCAQPAAEPQIALVWQAPAACPAQARIDELLAEALVGIDPNGSEPFTAIATVGQEGETWRALIDVRYAATSGQRELSAATCDELAATAVVIVSLLASGRDWPALAAPAPDDAPAAPPAAEPEIRAAPIGLAPLPRDGLPPPLPAAVVGAPPTDPGGRFVRVLLLAGVGAVSEPRGALAAAAGVTPDGLGGFAQVAWWPSLAETEGGQGIGLDVDLWSLTVAGCLTTTTLLPARLSLCGGPRVELLRATANVAAPRSDRAVLWALSAGLHASLPLGGSYHLATGLEGSWRLRSAELSVAPHGTVYDVRRWGAAVLAGVERTF